MLFAKRDTQDKLTENRIRIVQCNGCGKMVYIFIYNVFLLRGDVI